MSALPEERQETALERAQRRRDEALARPIVIRCQDCLWEQEGPVLEARRAWAEHRRDEHDDPSGIESVERIARPLTMHEIKRGGRKTKHSPRCATEGCSMPSAHPSTGLCHEHHRQAEREKKKASAATTPLDRIRAIPDRPIEEEATVEALGQCTKKGCDRAAVERRRVGRYFANWCQEHIDEWLAQKNTRGGTKLEAVPPPAREPEPVSEPPALIPDPAPSTSDDSLVGAAQRVTDLTERRRAMLAELDAIEAELREAIVDAQEALSACGIEDVA